MGIIINILLCIVFFLLGYTAKNLILYTIVKIKKVDKILAEEQKRANFKEKLDFGYCFEDDKKNNE